MESLVPGEGEAEHMQLMLLCCQSFGLPFVHIELVMRTAMYHCS